MTSSPQAATAPPCDCCGASAWEYLFTDGGIDLGRCARCGLHYVAQMPFTEERMSEMEAGHFAETESVLNADALLQGQRVREREFAGYVDVARRFAPAAGKWLDIGCGAGMLMLLAQKQGIEVEGIELTADRRQLARRVTGAEVHGKPLEELDLAPGSFAAITMINVFSHLTRPSDTLAQIGRVLMPGGILLLRTGVKKGHVISWYLGDHLYFLGDGTIEAFAAKLDFPLVHRERQWAPDQLFRRERFLQKGRSRLRNLVKSAIVHTPGAMAALRWTMLRRQADNPIHNSTLVLRRS
jgi:SAM-dependent methyltransferase